MRKFIRIDPSRLQKSLFCRLQKSPSSAEVEEWDEALPTRSFRSVYAYASIPLRSLRWIRTTVLPVENRDERS